jgi:cytoskeletal protein RodZ
MSEQVQDKKPKGNKPFILTVILLVIAIALGTLLFYGLQYMKNNGFQNKDNQLKEQKESIIEPTKAPTPEVTVSPTATPMPTTTPAPTEEPVSKTPVKVKGIYVTGPRAGSGEAMEDLIHLVDTTEINAMVIDIKNDSG